MSTNKVKRIENDEITLKDIILTIKEYGWEVLRHWYIVALCVVPLTSYLLYKAIKTKPTYNASLTFLVNGNEGSSLGIAAIAGKLGLDGLGGGNTNLDKITGLSKSRRIVQMALFRRAIIDGKDDFFANHLIRTEDLHQNWANDTTGLKDFTFKHGDFEKFTRTENSALLALYDILSGKNGIFSCSFAKMSEMLTLDLKTTNETLSIELLKAIFAELSEFYVEKTTTKESKTYKVLKHQSDSIRRLARSREASAASFDDRTRGLILNEDKLPSEQMKKEALIYNTMYAESQKNLAIAGFALENKAPYIQEIDTPIAPLEPVKKSKKTALLIGVFIGGFIGTGFVVLRKKIRDSLKSV
ncbi:MAG: hypothetical protein JNL70_08690 [Saprospiraceae bacterium]|nr:hypothetical protein [Saprospiraceae bacterium]